MLAVGILSIALDNSNKVTKFIILKQIISRKNQLKFASFHDLVRLQGNKFI